MKKLGYIFFALIFTISRLVPVKEKRIVLFNGHNRGLNGNLLEIKRALERGGKGYGIEVYVKRDMFGGGLGKKLGGAMRFFLLLPYHMATASCIFLNDNFLPLGYCRPSGRTRIVQLWHGAGAFKKFGLSTEENEEVRKQVLRSNSRLTHLFVTSKQVIPFYQEAFGIPAERIYAAGIPVTDVYFTEHRRKPGRERFYRSYPELFGKKLLLYTPTFRKSDIENAAIMEHFAVDKIHSLLGEEWVLLVKMHPKYPALNIPENSFCYNMTNYPYITDLYFVSDMLVTDYSSTVVEYALLDKPMIFYAYDLPEYDRGFYRNYGDSVPGPVARDEEEFYKLLQQPEQEGRKRQEFVRMQYDYKDGKSTERILGILEEAR